MNENNDKCEVCRATGPSVDRGLCADCAAERAREPDTPSPLDRLHKWAGASGYDVRIEARTDHDELSEVTIAKVAVHLPAEGRAVLEEEQVQREMRVGSLLDEVATEILDQVPAGQEAAP